MDRSELLSKLKLHATGMARLIEAASDEDLHDEMLWEGLEEHCKQMALLAADPSQPFSEGHQDGWAMALEDDEEMDPPAFELVPTLGMH